MREGYSAWLANCFPMVTISSLVRGETPSLAFSDERVDPFSALLGVSLKTVPTSIKGSSAEHAAYEIIDR